MSGWTGNHRIGMESCSPAQPHLKHMSIVSVFAPCRRPGWGSFPSGNRWACDIIAYPTSNQPPPSLLISDQSGRREARSRESSLLLPNSTLASVAMVTSTGPASILLFWRGEGDKGERREEERKGSRSEPGGRTPFLNARLVPASVFLLCSKYLFSCFLGSYIVAVADAHLAFHRRCPSRMFTWQNAPTFAGWHQWWLCCAGNLTLGSLTLVGTLSATILWPASVSDDDRPECTVLCWPPGCLRVSSSLWSVNHSLLDSFHCCSSVPQLPFSHFHFPPKWFV